MPPQQKCWPRRGAQVIVLPEKLGVAMDPENKGIDVIFQSLVDKTKSKIVVGVIEPLGLGALIRHIQVAWLVRRDESYPYTLAGHWQREAHRAEDQHQRNHAQPCTNNAQRLLRAG
jgi:hypothetical protein